MKPQLIFSSNDRIHLFLSVPQIMAKSYVEIVQNLTGRVPDYCWITENHREAYQNFEIPIEVLPGKIFQAYSIPKGLYNINNRVFAARLSSNLDESYNNTFSAAFRLSSKVYSLDEFGKIKIINPFWKIPQFFRKMFASLCSISAKAIKTAVLPLAFFWTIFLRKFLPPAKRHTVAVLGDSRVFYDLDANLLSQCAEVLRIPLSARKPVNELLIFIKILLHLHRIRSLYTFFANPTVELMGWFSKWGGLKTAVGIGGYDAISLPEIGYPGIYENPIQRKKVAKGLQWIDWILPDHPSLIDCRNPYFPNKKLGLSHQYKIDEKKIRTVYWGIDSEIWKPILPKKEWVVSVAFINSPANARLKGFHLIPSIAKMLPDTKFLIIGVNHPNYIDEDLPDNLMILPQLNQELPNWIGQAKVFLHPSITEGFCCSLAEGMMAGCVPVVSAVPSLSDMIGPTGIVVEKLLPENLADAIKKALTMNSDSPRKRAVELFSINNRADILKEVLGLEEKRSN